MNSNKIKQVHIFASQLNYSGSSKEKGALRASAAHSLRCLSRMPIATLEKIQWNEDLADENMLFINGSTMKLTSITEEQKSALIDEIAPQSTMNKRQKQVQLNNYRSKIKKAIKAEKKSNNAPCSELLASLLNNPSSAEIELVSTLEKLKPLLGTRANQRLNAVEKFIKAHNALTKQDKSGSSTLCQELIFKIPEKWSITSSELTHDDCFKIVNNFVRRVIPNHSIKFAVSHIDENINGVDCCPHIHVFISGQNNLTKEFDLRKCELKSLDKYVKEHSLEIDNWEHAKKQSQYYQSKARGRVWQEMFLRNCNAYFEHKKRPLEATRALKTTQYQAQLKEMRIQSKKPKAEREYSYYTHLMEKIFSLENEVSSKVADVDKIQVQLRELMTQKQQAQDLNSAELEALNSLKHYIAGLKSKVKELIDAKKILDDNRSNIQADLEEKQQEYDILKNAAQLLESNFNKAKQQCLDAEDSALTYLKLNQELKEKNNKLIQENQELVALEKVQPGDQSYKPILKIFKLIDDYYDLKHQEKPEQFIHKAESLLFRIQELFANLVNKLQKTLVTKYTKAKDQLINDECLTKRLKSLERKNPNSEYNYTHKQ